MFKKKSKFYNSVSGTRIRNIPLLKSRNARDKQNCKHLTDYNNAKFISILCNIQPWHKLSEKFPLAIYTCRSSHAKKASTPSLRVCVFTTLGDLSSYLFTLNSIVESYGTLRRNVHQYQGGFTGFLKSLFPAYNC